MSYELWIMNISTEYKILITILNRTENSSFVIHHSTFLHRLPRALVWTMIYLIKGFPWCCNDETSPFIQHHKHFWYVHTRPHRGRMFIAIQPNGRPDPEGVEQCCYQIIFKLRLMKCRFNIFDATQSGSCHQLATSAINIWPRWGRHLSILLVAFKTQESSSKKTY
jgi:hypothetical protein